jgi:hypothetical protein
MISVFDEMKVQRSRIITLQVKPLSSGFDDVIIDDTIDGSDRSQELTG